MFIFHILSNSEHYTFLNVYQQSRLEISSFATCLYPSESHPGSPPESRFFLSRPKTGLSPENGGPSQRGLQRAFCSRVCPPDCIRTELTQNRAESGIPAHEPGLPPPGAARRACSSPGPLPSRGRLPCPGRCSWSPPLPGSVLPTHG